MPQFRIEGYSKKTGRRLKSKVYTADDEDDAIALASEAGIVVDVESITPLPEPEPAPADRRDATEKQIWYALQLGVDVPDGATADEVSALIDLAHDKAPSAEYLAYAEKINVNVPRVVGKKQLFKLILAKLCVPGRERQLLAWFAFRVARSLLNGGYRPDVAPESPMMLEAADQLLPDANVIQSVKDYYHRDQTLIWFGEFHTPDGEIKYGSSAHSLAYNRVAEILAPKMDVDLKKHLAEKAHGAAPQGEPPGQRCEKKAMPLLLLALHRFYCRRYASGAAMLILTATVWGLIVSIPWLLVDLLMIVAGQFHDRAGNRIKW